MSPLIRSFFHFDSGTWTHVIVDPSTLLAVIIDPVLDFDAGSGEVTTTSAQRVLEYIDNAALTVAWILETHIHADHLSAAAWIRSQRGAGAHRARIGIGAGVRHVHERVAERLDLRQEFASDGSTFDRLFVDGDCVVVGALDIEVMATPGHTPDAVSYRVGDAVFVGDTLFAPRLGTARCDFPGADAAVLYRSIQRLFALPDDTRLFLCHDYPADGEEPVAQTTVSTQKAHNVMLNGETSEQHFFEARRARDATLPAPKLLWPSLQVNIRAGQLPEPEDNGVCIVRTPLRERN